MTKFEYYQHSFLPDIPEQPISEKLSFAQIQRSYEQSNRNERKSAFFASYITEFDCETSTNWWFTIKDSEYDISSLSSNRRHKIHKGRKYCETKKIDTISILDEIVECFVESFTGYPELYRPKNFNKQELRK